jgi:hypothetical protein
MSNAPKTILVDQIEPMILTIRDQKILVDNDLATLYGVQTKVLNQAVKRNRDRFPEDFMFQLTKGKPKRCGRKLRPQRKTNLGCGHKL